VLFTHWERRYPYLAEATPLAEEGLLVPFQVGGKNVGTVWAIHHERDRTFNAEDLRLLTSLSRFASAAYQATQALKRDEAHRVAEECAAKALRESERQFRLLINSITDYALFMLDPNGIIVSWNAGAKRIKGYTRDEIIGQHFSVFYPEQDRIAGKPTRALEAAATQGRYEAEGWRIRKDGSQFWANAVIDPIHDEDGKLIGFTKITRDITERRDAQIALQTTQEKLAQAQKTEALGQLTGGVAHDFNNLLMVINGYIQRIKDRLADDPKGLHAATAIEKAAKRGESLTRQLLSFARRQSLHPTVLDMAEVASRLRSTLAASLGGKILLVEAVAEDTWLVRVDENEFEFAILNIALNARDAMSGGGTLTIKTDNIVALRGGTLGDREGEFVALSIADTGPGIPPDILPKVFDPFFTTKEPGQGTGLGLSQVHGFAHQSGGTVSITSEAGQGTCVTLYLPRAVAERANAKPPVATRNVFQSCRVLLVEDNPAVADATCEMLGQLGCDVATVGNAQAALFELERTAFDLVLSDIAMPGDMNGLALGRAIKLKYPQLPVLLASGYSSAAQEAAREFFVLRKPYQSEDLIKAIADTIQRRQEGKSTENMVRFAER
jgi:PAS domain S-box-containing protein